MGSAHTYATYLPGERLGAARQQAGRKSDEIGQHCIAQAQQHLGSTIQLRVFGGGKLQACPKTVTPWHILMQAARHTIANAEPANTDVALEH